MSLRVRNSVNDVLSGASMATTQTSSVFAIAQIEGYSVQWVWSAGSASRSVVLTLSGSEYVNGTFTIIDSYTMDATAGNRMINVSDPNYNYIQLQATPSANGSGTVTGTITTYVRN